jgi:hypothetical protein
MDCRKIGSPFNPSPTITTTTPPRSARPLPLPPPPQPRNAEEVAMLASWARSHGAQWVRVNGTRVLFEARAMGDV